MDKKINRKGAKGEKGRRKSYFVYPSAPYSPLWFFFLN
jgi:hypothetical protein